MISAAWFVAGLMVGGVVMYLILLVRLAGVLDKMPFSGGRN